MKGSLFEEINPEKKKVFNNLLIQVHKSKFRIYVAKALICPDKFLGEEIETDTQSKFKDFLLLSTGYINKFDDNQILLDIILTDTEQNSLKSLNDDVYLLDKPLPITRIKTIYVKNKKIDSEDILLSLKNYNTGYISNTLFESLSKGKNQFKSYSVNIKTELECKDFNKQVIKYDKLMGLFASIKNANLYYINQTNNYQNYSNNYFTEFYDFENNKIVVRHWIEKNNFYNSKVGQAFIDRLNSTKYIDSDFISELVEIIDDTKIKEQFGLLLNDPLSKKDVLNFFESESYTQKSIFYYITLLFIYGKKGSNSKYAFKNNIVDEVPFEKIANALAFFGLYYGYTKLPAYEKIEIQDSEFRKILKTDTFNIKFELNSKFDYMLIESIYQNVFNTEEEILEINYLGELFENKIKAKPLSLPKNQDFKRWFEVKKENFFDIEHISVQKLDFYVLAEKSLKDKKVNATNSLFTYVYNFHREIIEYVINSNDNSKIKLFFEGNKLLEIFKNDISLMQQNKFLDKLN